MIFEVKSDGEEQDHKIEIEMKYFCACNKCKKVYAYKAAQYAFGRVDAGRVYVVLRVGSTDLIWSVGRVGELVGRVRD